jgi:hypothetical protein
MPAGKFTKRATTPKLRRQWTHVYDSVKNKGGSPGAAVRQANAVVKKNSRRANTRTAGRR